MGDLHGDLASTRKVLELAGIIDDQGHWSAGNTLFVQTGDVLDRGDDEQAILDLLLRLETEAEAAGGQVIAMHGNHELMNVAGDLRYVTPGGFADFTDVPGLALDAPVLEQVPEPARARVAAFLPGGIYARKIAHHKTIALIGDTLFVHGGVLPEHITYGIDKLNGEVTAWLRGEGTPPELLMDGEKSPVWSRHFSRDPADCALLQKTLDAAGAKRMVVGHTPQLQGITSACDEKVWRIDVGIADHYGGPDQALEITDEGVRVLR